MITLDKASRILPAVSSVVGDNFHLVKTVRVSGSKAFLLSTKCSSWRDFVLSTQRGVDSAFWVNLRLGSGYVFRCFGTQLSDIVKMYVLYGQQIGRSVLNDRQLLADVDRVPVCRVPWNNGFSLREFDVVDFGFRSNAVPESDWGSVVYLSLLWGIGWFLHFKIKPGGEVKSSASSGISSLAFNEGLRLVYAGLPSFDRDIVDSYLLYWSGVSPNVSDPCSSVLPLSTKSMADWTEDDFWNELTELYGKCKTRDDVKSVKQILEMKAKAMGIMDDGNAGVTNNFILLQERAMTALASLGIGRRVISDR
jgi:hypothetical protein